MSRGVVPLLVALTAATSLAPRAAQAEEAAQVRDEIADRPWRLIVGAPSVRLNAYPLGWQMNGEIGVEFLGFNVVAMTVSVSPEYGGGGGIGYLYQHTFVRDHVAIQAGAFLGYWVIAQDDWSEDIAFLSPTVRVLAGWRYVYLQVGFTAQIGTTAVPSFDIGLHFKV